MAPRPLNESRRDLASVDVCAACAADSLKEAAMPSLREERLVEQVAEIRPQLAKAREIAETARLREP